MISSAVLIIKLQDRLLMYPMVLKPLLDKCSVHPDQRVEKHPFLDTSRLDTRKGELARIVKMVVDRAYPCWKEAGVMPWLERNVQAVLDIVDAGQDARIKDYTNKREARFKGASLCLLRHYLLCEIPNIGLPAMSSIRSSHLRVTDPFPPSDSISVYSPDGRRPNAPSRRGGAQGGNQNMLELLMRSLLPTYDQNAPPQDIDQDPGPGGAAAIPHQINNSVNAIMDAMRALLNDLQGPEIPGVQEERENVDDENEAAWQEEENDFADHQRRPR